MICEVLKPNLDKAMFGTEEFIGGKVKNLCYSVEVLYQVSLNLWIDWQYSLLNKINVRIPLYEKY